MSIATVGSTLRASMVARTFDVQTVGAILDVSESTVRAWLKDTRIVTAVNAKRLGELFPDTTPFEWMRLCYTRRLAELPTGRQPTLEERLEAMKRHVASLEHQIKERKEPTP